MVYIWIIFSTATLPSSSSSHSANYKYKPTPSASPSSSTTKFRKIKIYSLPNDIAQRCEIKDRVLEAIIDTTCNNSNKNTKTIENSTSEPIPQTTVFKSEMDVLPKSQVVEIRNSKSISTTRPTIDILR